MEWLGKFLGLVSSKIPAVIPDRVKNQWLERLNDHNPFKVIATNHDLVRATRLAWIKATLHIQEEVHALGHRGEARSSVAALNAFDAVLTSKLRDARHLAFDRREHPGSSPIDVHIEAIINSASEAVFPRDRGGIRESVTSSFNEVLAQLSGWEPGEIPEIYGQVALNGLRSYAGGPSRPFGELVFAAFAELIKDPRRYPEAREAFYVAMDDLGREIGQATLAAVKGLDAKLDITISGLDTLQILREGIAQLEFLPDIASTTARTETKVDEVLRILSENERVPLETLRAILREMGEAAETLGAEQIGESLMVKAAEFKSLTERLNRLSNADLEVLRLRKAAASELAKGRFSLTDDYLAEAEARDLSCVEEFEMAARQRRLSAAESRAERAAATRLRANPEAYRQAAIHYEKAAQIALPADTETAERYLGQKGLTLIELGREFGVNAVLLEAIEHFRTMLRSVNRREHPEAWVKTQINLGTALSILGERESEPVRLAEAIAAYHSASAVADTERLPIEWVMAQINLGNALSMLGERDSDSARLEEAVTAYCASLAKLSRERRPLQWATTQNNLGTTLMILGQRENDSIRLEEAVVAHRAAMEERKRERVPLDWATTQNNLGNALLALGERESSTTQLEEAVAAYRAALEEWTRERVPLRWAATQNNLGNALTVLGDRESGTARLVEAVAAYDAALGEWTRERVPLDWAMAQNNLGNALSTIGQREGGTACLEEAVKAFHAALEEWTFERVPLDWATCCGNLGAAICIIADRCDDLALAEQALDQFAKSADVFRRAGLVAGLERCERQLSWARALVEELKTAAG